MTHHVRILSSYPVCFILPRLPQFYSFSGTAPYTLECWIYASISEDCQVGFSKINRGTSDITHVSVSAGLVLVDAALTSALLYVCLLSTRSCG